MMQSKIHLVGNVYRGSIQNPNSLSTTVVPQKILSGQRVSIPDQILKEWGLETGDYVLVSKEGKRMYIAPAKFQEA